MDGDEAFNFLHKDGDLQGVVLTHVDDLLHGGTGDFQKGVMREVRESFIFSQEESDQFRYIGMNMIQSRTGIFINQDHYI